MTDAGQPLVAVVVLNYNRAGELKECVQAIRDSDYGNKVVIVVDNGSKDGPEVAVERTFPGIQLVQTGRNRGYAGGMNAGIEKALQRNADYILLANSDTVLEIGSIRLLLDALEGNQSAGAASGTIYYHDTSRVWYAGGDLRMIRASAFPRRSIKSKGDGSLGRGVSVTFLSGCVMLLRASAIRQVGLFDERFFMYLEDAELCVRLLRDGFQLLYVPDAVIHHKVEHEGDRPLPMYYSARNRLLFLKLCAGGPTRLAGFLYLLAVLAAKVAWWRLRKPRLAAAAVAGILDYFRGRFYEGRGISLFGEGAGSGTMVTL